MGGLSLAVTGRHFKKREDVIAHLEELCNLSKGTNIAFIIGTDHAKRAQIIRQVRCVRRMLFELLKRFEKLSLNILVVVNPAYSTHRSE